MTLLARLLPAPGETRYHGARAALWILGALIAVKVAMSVNSIFNTAEVAGGVDGIPLASYGAEAARSVLLFFALWALGHLMVALTALLALVRYRAFVPLAFLLLLAEHGGRWLIVISVNGMRTGVPFAINLGMLSLIVLGLGLSLRSRGGESHDGQASH